jgi:hypothetical protein
MVKEIELRKKTVLVLWDRDGFKHFKKPGLIFQTILSLLAAALSPAGMALTKSHLAAAAGRMVSFNGHLKVFPFCSGAGKKSLFEKLVLTFNLGGFASEISEVVQPRPSHPALGYDFNFINYGRVSWKDALNANTVGDLSDCKARIHGTFAAADNYTLKNLDPLFVTLFDAYMDGNRVTGAERREIEANLL